MDLVRLVSRKNFVARKYWNKRKNNQKKLVRALTFTNFCSIMEEVKRDTKVIKKEKKENTQLIAFKFFLLVKMKDAERSDLHVQCRR